MQIKPTETFTAVPLPTPKFFLTDSINFLDDFL